VNSYSLVDTAVLDQCLDIVDIKPANMEELTEVITAAEFHPTECNVFVYSSSKGSIRLCDMRSQALCDQHAKCAYGRSPLVINLMLLLSSLLSRCELLTHIQKERERDKQTDWNNICLVPLKDNEKKSYIILISLFCPTVFSEYSSFYQAL